MMLDALCVCRHEKSNSLPIIGRLSSQKNKIDPCGSYQISGSRYMIIFTCKRAQYRQYHYQTMHSYDQARTYNYTLYNTQEGKKQSQTSKTLDQPLFERDRNTNRAGHFTTIHSQDYKYNAYEPLSQKYQEPISKQPPYQPQNASFKDQHSHQHPLTFPYKNPQCGISISGKSGFEIKGDFASIKIEKVLNSRNGGKSGTLRLHLIRMPYFYDGGEGIKPEEYTSVCTAHLGELEGGWSFNDIVRGGMKRSDDSTEYSYRKCYVLLLEQYSQGKFKIVDYMNFD